MKTKWPNLRPINDQMPRWFLPHHLRTIRSMCARITRRTGMLAWIDTARADICFGFVAADGDVRLPMSCKLFRDIYKTVPCLFDPILDQWHEDDIVYALQLARVDPKKKKQWADAVEKSAQSDKRAEMEKKIETSTKQAEKMTERAYERYTMGKHYKGRLAVNGLRS